MKRCENCIVPVLLLVAGVLARGEGDAYLLHVPGVGGHLPIDDRLLEGLQLGGIRARGEIYDWTSGSPGLPALAAYNRNQQQAAELAARLTAEHRANASRRIILTSHSGGCAIAVWTLERLPDDVCVDTLLMIAPALSPKYDLTRALKHVNGQAYVFVSPYDWVLDWGTRTFGTMDRAKVVSAGLGGFEMPAAAEEPQYSKLVQIPYDPAWMKLGHAGDHAGPMTTLFARTIFAPLLQTGRLPTATTQPQSP